MRAWLVVVLLAACGPIPTPGPASRAPIVAALVRGNCLDGCPVYAVAIYADGTVQYDGAQNVREVGRRVTHIDAHAIAELRAAFADSHWATAATPRMRCDDLATVSVTFEGKTLAWMIGDQAAPVEIVGLASEIDAAAGTAGVGTAWHLGTCP